MQPSLPAAARAKFTLSDLRDARASGAKVAMLTCYEFTTARLMDAAGVPMLLVGDSAAGLLLGHVSTLPVPLSFMIQITAGVRRGAPHAFVVADMPFGSYGASVAAGVRNVARMVKLTGCDGVKMEVAASRSHLTLVRWVTDMGVAVVAHLGLRPQTVGVLGGSYKTQGRTASAAEQIVRDAETFDHAGAAAILLEAVPPEVAVAVVDAVSVPVIGCGAGPACHAQVVVSHDVLGLSERRPKFAPAIESLGGAMTNAFSEFTRRVATGQYPAAEHLYGHGT